MGALSYIGREYRTALLPYTVGSALWASAPWTHGPFLTDFIGTFIGTYVALTLWVFILRPTYLSLTKKR